MERRTYNATSLEDLVRWFEAKYGVSSEDLARMHRAGGSLDGLAEFDRHVWLSFYGELCEAREGGFAASVIGTLTAA